MVTLMFLSTFMSIEDEDTKKESDEYSETLKTQP